MDAYEKKYNDLIARINEAKEKPRLCMKDKHHYNGYVESGIRDALDYIVSPETEDERIRKEIVGFIEQVLKDKNVLLLVADRIGDDMPNMIPGWIAYLEKQKEQKPAEKISVSEELYEHIRNTCACIDDAMSSDTMCDMTDYLTMADSSAQKAFDMVERLIIKKPAEWSEEDDACYETIKGILEDNLTEEDKPEYVLSWFKTHYSHSRWKPSEEQMKALENSTALNEEQGAHLYSLLCDLRKLM